MSAIVWGEHDATVTPMVPGQPGQGEWIPHPRTGRPFFFWPGELPMHPGQAAAFLAEQAADGGDRQRVQKHIARMGEATTVQQGRVTDSENHFIRHTRFLFGQEAAEWICFVRMNSETSEYSIVCPFIGSPIQIRGYYGTESTTGRWRVVPVAVAVSFQPDGKVWAATSAAYEEQVEA